MSMASRSPGITTPPTSEPHRSAAWREAWAHIDALERLLRDESVGVDREALMQSVLGMRYTLVHGS